MDTIISESMPVANHVSTKHPHQGTMLCNKPVCQLHLLIKIGNIGPGTNNAINNSKDSYMCISTHVHTRELVEQCPVTVYIGHRLWTFPA